MDRAQTGASLNEPGESTGITRRATIRLAGGLASVVMVASADRAYGQGPTPAAMPAVLDLWLTVWGEDPSQIGQLYVEDAVIEDVPSGSAFTGLDQIQEVLGAEWEALPDHVFEVHAAFGVDTMAAMTLREIATYTGTYPGIPPGEGQPIDFRAAVIFEIANGMVQRESRYYDNLTLLTQFGVLEPPEGEGGESEATPEG